VEGCCECSTEPLGSINCWEVLVWLHTSAQLQRVSQLVMTDSIMPDSSH
jgi:hypothetical protein